MSEAMDKIFSDEKLTKGEWIQIILVCILIVLMIMVWFKSSCQLDCSMCPDCLGILEQKPSGIFGG